MLVAVLLALAGCEKPPPEPPPENATPSPNASILPAPLSSLGQPAAESPLVSPVAGNVRRNSDPEGKLTASDGSVALPEAFRTDQPPEDDPLTQREFQGVSLEGEWRYPESPPLGKAAEVNQSGVDTARKLTAFRMTVHLASIGRMTVIFDSRAFSLGQGSEIRARGDRYGHVLVWPNGSQYRVLPPGAVRTLLGERRVDATPLVRPQTVGVGEGARRDGYATRKWDLATRTGKLALEQAKISSAGDGGILLCRLLCEMIAIDPSAAPCASDDVPLRAQFTWPLGGSIVFEVAAVADRVEFSAGQLLVPPSGGDFTVADLPPSANGVFLTRDELAALRLRAVDVPNAVESGAPVDGLLLYNATDCLRYAFLDGIPIAWVSPNREQLVQGPLKGRYSLQWRTFLSDVVDLPTNVELPARIATGLPEVGRDR